jgi:hypothetical protein
MDFAFRHTFRNSVGSVVSGTWFDPDETRWHVSTVPLNTFATEESAIDFYHAYCDPETGLQISAPYHFPEEARRLRERMGRMAALANRGDSLLHELKQVMEEHRTSLRRLRETVSQPRA